MSPVAIPTNPISIKAFVTYDPFIDNTSGVVSSIYELSDIGSTYAIEKQQYYNTNDSRYSLYVFKITGATLLGQADSDLILNIVKEFSAYLTNNVYATKQQAILDFTTSFNTNNPTTPISDLTYSNVITSQGIKAPDYVSFTVNDIQASIWLSDDAFRTFYPDYEIGFVLPFDNFTSLVNSPSNFLSALDAFDLVEFNNRIDQAKAEHPPTVTKILNIPYQVPNTTTLRDCYFAFNIYGIQGTYDYILKLELYDYLVNTLGLSGPYIESIFPSILNINEFFILPRWERMALPSYIGQNGINSQITLAFNQPFDVDKYLTVYRDSNNNVDIPYLSANTYNVPYDYNNILLHIVNGYYSEANLKDFKEYYSDLITVTSTHPDFSRMSTRTQNLVTLLENMLQIADSDSPVEMFNKLVNNTNYTFNIINRDGIEYLSSFYDQHQYYVIPKYKFLDLL
jgi:hypothetical protein